MPKLKKAGKAKDKSVERKRLISRYRTLTLQEERIQNEKKQISRQLRALDPITLHERIIRTLKKYPKGLHTSDIRKMLSKERPRVITVDLSANLSTMAARGHIKRERVFREDGIPLRARIWKVPE